MQPLLVNTIVTGRPAVIVKTQDGPVRIDQLRRVQLAKLCEQRGIDPRYPKEVDPNQGDLPKEMMIAMLTNTPLPTKTKPLGRNKSYDEMEWMELKQLCVARGITLSSSATRAERAAALVADDEKNTLVLKE